MLAVEAEARGVTLALENMNVLPAEAEIRYLGCTAAEVREIIDAAGSPALTYCADLGHAHLLPGGVPEFLAAAGSRIGHVQLTDNDGVIDDHLPLGAGTLPLRETLSLLDGGPYRGPIAVELDGAADREASLTAIREVLDALAARG